LFTRLEAENALSQARAETERRVARPLLPLLTNFSRSYAAYEEAKKHLPSGASSNIRVHDHTPFPILFKNGLGSRVRDLDENEYVDLLLAYGALILGHAHPAVVDAVAGQLRNGSMLGTTTELEVEVAKKIQAMVPSAEIVSFSNTGTEATMEAIRTARAFTGRDKLLKFEGHYHGHHDYVLFSVESPSIVAGLEQAPSKLPFYPGIPEEIAKTVVVAKWNDTSALERVVKRNAADLAAIIMEPVLGSAGIILPEEEYLKSVREIADKYDLLLIFDEVLTGFRLAPGGAQEFYGVKPDLSCFAKALGGGAPIAAVTGRRDVMSMIGPGRIGYGGTYNGNSMCLAAAKATLRELTKNDDEQFRHMHVIGARIMEGLGELMERYDHEGVVQGLGPMFQVFFTKERKITGYRQTLNVNTERFRAFRNLMLQRGVYFHPDGMERIMISAAHDELDVERVLGAAEESLRELPRTHQN
jgi:glutamate-1-semialdehyde 2,1-aminomutase